MAMTDGQHVHADDFWIPLRQVDRADTRLFLFPFAGGSAHSFHRLLEHLPPSWEIFGLQLPGRGARLSHALLHQFFPALEELMSHQAPLLDRPSIFWGHSLGAIMAYEVARRWAHGKPHPSGSSVPQALVISACVAPRYWPNARGNTLRINDTKDLAVALRQYGDTFSDLLDDEEILEFLLPTAKADFDVIESYCYAGRAELKVPILAFHGTQDRIVETAKVHDWAEETYGPFTARAFAGGHYFYREQEREVVTTLVDFLRSQKN